MLRAAIIPVTPLQQNCTLLFDDATKRAAVVDPGGDVPRILEAVASVGVTVETILITHGHIDHAGGAAELKEALGVPVVGPHEADRFLLDRLPETGLSFGIAGARALVPDRWLQEGDTVDVAGVTLAVLHCPGHSPGSVVFVAAEQRFALVGDVLFRGSIGRTDLPGGDHMALLGSVRDKLFPLGDDVTFICGHGPTSTIGEERATNPFFR